ncbi:MAG TPA: Fic family protein [Planctomycetaceae bacterium]|nr:Fic family protein [Planctomycetaceae bacterium]
MMSFRGGRLADCAIPISSVWMLSDIAEAKGKQELYVRQAPQVLNALREMALVQSVESSNRIEGVTVAANRLRPLVLGNAKPRDRSEVEIQNYRQALRLIHSQAASLSVTPVTLRRLHRIIQAGAGDAGEWKTVDNEIVELTASGRPRIRFHPTPAAQTVAAVDELCLSYRMALDQQHVPPLVAIAALVFDFLCIHPFRDGNGRVSRLLTLLALYQHGFEVGRYISLERFVEESRDDYYTALERSSANWHKGRHDLLPWLNHFLAIISRAYREFADRAGRVKSPRGAKSELIRVAIQQAPNPFRIADLHQLCPGVSVDWIRQTLKDLRQQRAVECLGRGPSAQWRRLRDED